MRYNLKCGVEIVLALGWILCASTQAADSLKPNIVLFLSDDHGVDFVGCTQCDPYELHNLAANSEHTERIAALRAALD